MKATIFNIQKFSLHDGPGIRTVIFFKGCPLRCQWCANPESQILHSQILWKNTQCQHCYHCQNSCLNHCIVFKNNHFHLNYQDCSNCHHCIQQCSNQALENTGTEMDIATVMTEIRKDIDFYQESGGGITLSGGEVLMQPQFAAALLAQCRAEGLHTAIETTGYATDETFRLVTHQVDLILFDLKHYEDKAHQQYTGVSNQQIIRNMRMVVENGKQIIARIPVIPKVNDALKDAQAFARLLTELNIHEVELLPFHQFGEPKYTQLGLEYQMKEVNALHPEDLKDYCLYLQNAGFAVRI